MSRLERMQRGFEAEPLEADGRPVRTVPNPDERDFTDPETQHEILNPAPICVVLEFENGLEKPIEIKTAWTPNMVNRRRILDELGQLQTTVALMLAERTPDGSMPTTAWLTENARWFGWATSHPDVLLVGRRIIAKLSGCKLAEIEEGLSTPHTATVIVSLITLYANFTKNAARGKAAPVSDSVQSTPA
jgi:hypothetical protein